MTETEIGKIAEYLALATDLRDNDPTDNYRRANTLSMDLAMNLPEELYRALGQVLVSDKRVDVFKLVVRIRKWWMGVDAGDVSTNDIIYHAPNIGEERKKKKKGGKE